jgi:hypothetical protein
MFTRAREAAAEMRRRRGEPPKDEEKPSEWEMRSEKWEIFCYRN